VDLRDGLDVSENYDIVGDELVISINKTLSLGYKNQSVNAV